MLTIKSGEPVINRKHFSKFVCGFRFAVNIFELATRALWVILKDSDSEYWRLMKILMADRGKSSGRPRTVIQLTRRVCALSLAFAFLNVTISAAPLPISESSAGVVHIVGNVKLNEHKGLSGQTIFSRTGIVTAANSECLIEYRNYARLKLTAESDVTVDTSNQRILGSLLKGQILGRLPAGVSLDLHTADSAFMTDGRTPVSFSIQTRECEGTILSVREGIINVRTGGTMSTVKAGQDFSTLDSNSIAPGTPQNFSHRKRLGLIIGISAAVAILLIALAGRDHETAAPGGCIDILSGDATCR
jgi:hypothetical protein